MSKAYTIEGSLTVRVRVEFKAEDEEAAQAFAERVYAESYMGNGGTLVGLRLDDGSTLPAHFDVTDRYPEWDDEGDKVT